MKLIDNNGAWYSYDATGERALKLTGPTMYINQNGIDYYSPILLHTTLYANPLITLSDRGYTKHYFEEGRRICSKIGGGELKDINNNIDGITNTAQDLRDIQTDGVHEGINICMGIYPELSNYDISQTVKEYEQQVTTVEPGYYYTSDHLGSSSYITDDNGSITQSLAYLPYGEDWVDLKHNNPQYQTPYKFNGKEKDEESGYHYYGARYLNNDLSIWLSVDPLSEKYPSTSSYAYCRNNPVMLIDPDGRDYDLAINHEDKTITISAVYFANDRSYESAVQATAYWNNKSDIYSYRVGKGDSQTIYKIKFDLKVIKNEDYNESYSKNTNRNTFSVLNEKLLESNENGKAVFSQITVNESRKKSNTGAHEVGHTLGLGHYYSGIMSGETGNKTDRFYKNYVEDIFNNAFNRDPKANDVGKGIGTVKEEGTAPENFYDRKSNEVFNN